MSESEIVHPVPVEDLEPWLRAVVTTFLGDPYGPDFAERITRWRPDWLDFRTWGVRDGERYVATLATEDRMITVPGVDGATVDLPADGLTCVTVAATHRRQGLLSRMVVESLAEAKDAGLPLAILLAAEWPIYGRFGYAPATWCADYTLHTRSCGAVASAEAGRVRQAEPAEVFKVADEIFERARTQRAGQVDRRGTWWARKLVQAPYGPFSGTQPHWFLHDGPDGPDGVLAWKVAQEFRIEGPMGAVEVDEFVAASDAAYRDLWAYLAGLDVVGEIVRKSAAVDEPLPWLLDDARALRETNRVDDTWLRLLDVPAALSARGYACAGDVVLQVIDDAPGGYAAGRFRLSADASGASCAPTTDAPDLQLPQRSLASAYLGGTSLRRLSIAGGIEEHTPGAVARLDTMLATPLLPWNATGF